MRFCRLRGPLTAAALLAALPAHSQATAPSPAPSPTTTPTAPTLTPPGSVTPLPLIPGPGTPGATNPAFPNVGLPSTPLNTVGGGYPGFTAPGLPGVGDGTGTDLSSVLSGSSTLPLSLTLGQLNSQWRRMTITGTFDLGSVTQTLTSLLGSAGIGVYYTQGQTVSVGQTTYLVAYRTQPNVLNVAGLIQAIQTAQASGKPPAAERLTAQTPLSLALLNLQTSGSLTDIRPFDLSRELADSAAAVHAYNSLLDSMGMKTTPSAAPAPGPTHHPARKYSPA
jgi:hypothetical protein